MLIYLSSLEHDIKFIISRNESLTEYTKKNEISQLLFKYQHGHKERTKLFIETFNLIIK